MSWVIKTTRWAAAVVAGALLWGAPAAEAGFTTVKPARGRGLASHERILERVYGGNFVGDPSGLSFSNETGVTVTRLEDSGAGQTDELWSQNRVSSRLISSNRRQLRTASYFGRGNRVALRRTLDTSSPRHEAAAEAGEGGLWLVRGRNGRRAISSVAAVNRDDADHLVTYEVNGIAEQAGQDASVYLLCWEDKFARRSDWDFNDVVAEVRTAAAAPSEPLLIPLPPAVSSGLLGLAGLAGVGVYRRVRRGLRNL